ncbi:MAG: hypothetical protein M1818_001040 [Claussenomyces sp. TS43310]|nr:MAG: hypothetical protein M1818_001040 [Claussenomyces sp. TS43310]
MQNCYFIKACNRLQSVSNCYYGMIRELFFKNLQHPRLCLGVHIAEAKELFLGIDALVHVDAVADKTNPTAVVLVLGPPFKDDWPTIAHYQDNNFVKNYTITMATVVEQLPALDSRFNASRHFSSHLDLARAMINLESQIAGMILRIKMSAEQTTSQQRFSITELQNLVPELDLHHLLIDLIPGEVPEEIIVESTAYLRFVSELVGQTDKGVVQKYLSWKLIQKFYSYVEADSIKPLQDKIQDISVKGGEPVFITLMTV